MEPVAPNALLVELIGYRVAVRDVVMAAMKGRIEAGNLRDLWQARKNRFDRREIMRLVQRCERNQALQSRNDAVVDKNGPVIIGTPMNHAVPNRDRYDPVFLAQPGSCHHQCSGHVRDTFEGIVKVGQRLPVKSGRTQPRQGSYPVNLTLELPANEAIAIQREDLKLHAGRTRIDHKDCIHGHHAAALTARRRGAKVPDRVS